MSESFLGGLSAHVPLLPGNGLLAAADYYKAFTDIYDLSDLAQRPVMLEMIVKTLPKLIDSKKPIHRSVLYEEYLKGELARQRHVKRRTLIIKDDERFRLLRMFALSHYRENRNGGEWRQMFKNRRSDGSGHWDLPDDIILRGGWHALRLLRTAWRIE